MRTDERERERERERKSSRRGVYNAGGSLLSERNHDILCDNVGKRLPGDDI